jgi:hypothetical protein
MAFASFPDRLYPMTFSPLKESGEKPAFNGHGLQAWSNTVCIRLMQIQTYETHTYHSIVATILIYNIFVFSVPLHIFSPP